MKYEILDSHVILNEETNLFQTVSTDGDAETERGNNMYFW